MNKKTRMPAGLYALIAAIILLDIYYFYKLSINPPTEQLLKITFLSLIIWVNIIIVILSIIIIPYGFIKQKKYAHNFAIIFLLWFLFWNILMLVYREEIIMHYTLFVIMVILLMYLLMSNVKKYFTNSTAIVEYKKPNKFFEIGGYTLYKREVKKKDGGTRTFYYFSKTPSEKGIPAKKPENYKVKVNPKTGVPYLKKENHG
jgi:hypothetical protein